MKNKLVTLLGLCCATLAATAVADEAQTAEPTVAVASAAQKLTLLNGKINPDAQVYFYLHSASWCGPCRAAMPGIVDIYKAMKEDGRAEIILVSYDKTPEGAAEYISHYQSDMPTVWAGDDALAMLPSFAHSRGIPMVTVVDAQGKVIAQGAPTRIHQWKQYVK